MEKLSCVKASVCKSVCVWKTPKILHSAGGELFGQRPGKPLCVKASVCKSFCVQMLLCVKASVCQRVCV